MSQLIDLVRIHLGIVSKWSDQGQQPKNQFEAYFTAQSWNPFRPACQSSAAFCSHGRLFNNRYSARVSLALCSSLGGHALTRTSALGHYYGTADIDDDLEFVPAQVLLARTRRQRLRGRGRRVVGLPRVPPRARVA